MAEERRYRWSNEVAWNTTRKESFRFRWIGFDVRLAKEYLALHRLPIQYSTTDELKAWVQGPAGQPPNPHSGRIDASRLKDADPDMPLVFVETSRGGFLIDGHHRLERGLTEGRAEFPVVVIREPAIGRRITKDLTAKLVHWWLWRGAGRPPRLTKVPPVLR